MHKVAARLGCNRTMVGIRWANSGPGCMSKLRKHYSHPLGGREDFLDSKLVFANRKG